MSPKQVEFVKRLPAAIILLAVFSIAILYYPTAFKILLGITGVLALYEWFSLSKKHIAWSLTGLCLVIGSITSLILLYERDGAGTLIAINFMIIASDTFAYGVGKLAGKNLLCPTVSPNKTQEGALGGLFGAILVFSLIPIVSSTIPMPSPFILMALLLAASAQLGDYIESMLKRFAGVKDSSKLIPGHGGVLDRVDGFLIMPILWFLFTW